MDNSATVEAQKGLTEVWAGINRNIELKSQERQDRERRRREENSKHGEDVQKSRNEATSQRKDQLNSLNDTAEEARRNRALARQTEAERLSKLEADEKMRRDELKSDHQKRVESMRVEAGEQAAQQTELLDEQLHSQQKLIAAQDNAHQKEMVDTKSAFDDQKLEQDTDLDAKKLEITQAKDLHRENEREIKNKLELTKQEIYREQLLVQKTQIDIQLKHLNVYRTMCNTKDSEKYYTDNIVPSVKNANNCTPDIESIIRHASNIVKESKVQPSSNDYNKVSEQTCNFTMSACEQAIGDLNIGRSSITSRAIGSLKSLSHGLAKREREEFLDALYNLEESEDQLRKLCEQVKSNVNYRYDIGELLGLIKNIEDAKKIFKEQIRYIPAEESVAKAKEQITILEKEVEDINQILFNPVKTLSVAGSSAQHALKQ